MRFFKAIILAFATFRFLLSEPNLLMSTMLTITSAVYAAEDTANECTVSIFFYPTSTTRTISQTFTSTSTIVQTLTSRYATMPRNSNLLPSTEHGILNVASVNSMTTGPSWLKRLCMGRFSRQNTQVVA
jgi:hypothetical protein